MFEALERVVRRGDLTDADGAPVRFAARPPATAGEVADCQRLLRRDLPDEYAAFLRRWNGVRVYRRHTPADRPEGAFDGLTLSLMGTEELAAYAWHPRVALVSPGAR